MQNNAVSLNVGSSEFGVNFGSSLNVLGKYQVHDEGTGYNCAK